MRILWKNNEIFSILFGHPAGSPGGEVFIGRIENSITNLSKN